MHEISNNVVCATSKASDQSDQSLCLSFDYSITVMLLTKHHLEFLSLKGCCTGLSESTLVKMSHCWKSYAASHIFWTKKQAAYLPSLISIVEALETTSLEARSLAVGAYLSMYLSPSELSNIPPSPRQPSVIKQPAP